MAFWSLKDWEDKAGEIVTDFDAKNFSDGCYRLALGSEAIVSAEAEGQESIRQNIRKNGELRLLPGQFAYLITEERVQIPRAAIGLINLSTSIKMRGILNASGFHVDPGYNGRLIFSVLNVGAQTVHLKPNERMFRLWLMYYDGIAEKKEDGYSSIPLEWADRLVGAFPSPFAMQRRMVWLETGLDDVRSRQWTLYAALFLISVFLFPLVASLYANIFESFVSLPE